MQKVLVALGHHIGTAETETGTFGPQTKTVVTAWQRANKLPPTGKLDPRSLALLMQQGRELTRTVSGTVTLGDGTPVPGLRVTAHDVDFRAEELLGEAQTDAQGRYAIEYTLLKAARAEKDAADIAISVFRPRGRTPINPPAPGATRPVLMNAPIEAEINVTIALADSGLPSEFERIAADLRPLIGKVPFADIAHNRDAEEGLFLSRETGISLDRVAHFAVAHRMADASKLPATYFYALLRENGLFGLAPGRPHAVNTPVGFATDTQAVLHEAALLEPAEAKAAVARAVRKNVVPAIPRQQLNAAIKALEGTRHAADTFARTERPRQIISLIEDLIEGGKAGDMLALLQANDPHDLPALFAKLDASNVIAAQSKSKVKSRIQLGQLLGFNAGLVDEVSNSMGVTQPADIRNLAKLNRKDWSKTLTASKSLTVGGAPVAPAVARTQASVIVRRFETAFPTTAFAAQLARRQPTEIANLADVVDLLEAHPEFELERHNLLPFLSEAGVDVATLPQAVIDETNKLQRIFVLTGNYSKTEALIAAGFGASADIVGTGRTQFVNAAKLSAGIEQAEAEAIFAKAENTNMAALTLATNLRVASSGPMQTLSTALPSTATAITPVAGVQPNLQSLFLTGDCCECDHANSIYGPAAYFADVMGFLKRRLVRGGIQGDARKELFERRPDLADIDLNGPNAETPVPHIDIVCELLEEAVSSSPVYPYSGLLFAGAIPNRITDSGLIAAIAAEGYSVSGDAMVYGPFLKDAIDHYVLRDAGITVEIKTVGTGWTWRILRQTHGTPEERAAVPEYFNQGAYDKLADANSKAAFLLPFDLFHAEVTAYLKTAGVERAWLMETFQTAGLPSDAAIDAELLGLSPADRDSIFVADVPSQTQIWGAPLAPMSKLDVFSNKTGLNFGQIEKLIALNFIRGSVNLFIRHNDNSCDLASKELVHLDDAVRDRIHRLIKLSRKTGLSLYDLDRLISAPKIGAGILDLACLAQFAEIVRISRLIDVKVETLITWLDVVPFEGAVSDHAKLFDNPSVTGPISPSLSASSMLANPTLALNSDPLIASGIAAAMRTAQANVESIIAAHRWGPNLTLDFGVLGEICGRIELAETLRLDVNNLIALEAMLPQSALSNPSGLRAFVGHAQRIAEARTSVTEMADILQPSANTLLARDAADQPKIAATLTSLRDSLVKVTAQNAPVELMLSWSDANLAALAAATAPVFIAADAEVISAIVRNNTVSSADSGAAMAALNKFGLSAMDIVEALTRISAVSAAIGTDNRTVANQHYLNFVLAKAPGTLLSDSVLDAKIAEGLTALDAKLREFDPIDSADIAAICAVGTLPIVAQTYVDLASAALAKIGAAAGLQTSLDAVETTSLDLQTALDDNATTSTILAAKKSAVKSAQFAFVSLALRTLSEIRTTAARQDAIEKAVASSTQWTPAQTAALLGDSAGLLPSLKLNGSRAANYLNTLDTFAPNNAALSPSSAPGQFRAMRMLAAVARLIAPFKPSVEALSTILQHGSALGWMALDDVPFETGSLPVSVAQWRACADLFALASVTEDRPDPDNIGNRISVWSTFADLAQNAGQAEFLRCFAVLKGYPLSLVTDADTVLAAVVASYFQVSGWMQLDSASAMVRTLDVPASEAAGFTVEPLDSGHRKAAQSILRSKYERTDWLNAAKTIMDPIRELKRDALVSYLMATNTALTTVADLYDHFLTDPEWSAKMPSSRLVHAHGTAQLFILRCLSGLEPDAIADTDADPDWSQWDCMRSYRGWEVNRKVFVEPQYYLRPEWRDNKTELFEAFESHLQQNEVNADNVNAAFEGYLDSLDQIAFMDVLATCYDYRLDNMHVFAATKGGQPQLYYHCMLQRERVWTSWRKIDLDITGDHLIAFMRDDRLSLAWLNFLEKGDDNQDVSYPQPGDSMVRPKRFTEMRLAVSEYSGKRWLPRREAIEPLLSPMGTQTLDRKDIQLVLSANDEWFVIQAYKLREFKIVDGVKIPLEPLLLGGFELSGCKGYPEIRQEDPERPRYASFRPQVKDGAVKAQRFAEQNKDGDDEFAMTGLLPGGALHTIFGLTPGLFRVTYPIQASIIDRCGTMLQALGWQGYLTRLVGLGQPFFYEDNQRGYMLMPQFAGFKSGDSKDEITYTFSQIRHLLEDTFRIVEYYLKLLGDANLIKNPDLRKREQERIRQELAGDAEAVRLAATWRVFLTLRPQICAQNFYHPMLCTLRKSFFSGGVKKMLARSTQMAVGPFVFEDAQNGYNPIGVYGPYPKQELEFGRDRVYGTYNWELTFDIPFMIADKLMSDGKFDEAESWLRLIFDPLSTSNAPHKNTNTPSSRYWSTKPFYLREMDDYRAQIVTNVMNRIAQDPAGAVETELADAILEWRRNPFKPYLVARGRTVAFQQATVFKTIRLYIEQGDSFFRRDQLEDLVTASLYYSRAERLLGPRPKVVPPAVKVPPETFSQLDASLDLFGNALRGLENLVPNIDTLPQGGAELPPPPIDLSSLYFCIPPSEKLYELWDLLEERQFNLRNSRNIDGVERSLSLFAPPLSVEALIQASASGLSLSEILSSASAPRPPYRFRIMLRHAIELADIASGFSREMEQALSSKDAEGLTRLKMQQEIRLQNEQVHMMREEIAAAGLAIESARRGKAIHQENQSFYSGRPFMNPLEIAATATSGASLIIQTAIAVGYASSGILSLIPNFILGASGMGGTPHITAKMGGADVSNSARDLLVGTLGAISGALDKASGMLSQQASFQLRKEEWDHSVKLADLELARSDVEIAIAGIREGIAKEQLRLHGIKQQQLAAEEAYIKSKFTNRELFDWLSQQLRGLSRQMFNLAFEAARAAENCYNFEMGTTESFIRSGQWNENRKGLLAASNLVADLRKMESAHLKHNVREREMTKHISVGRLDPFALHLLRTTGSCTISVPEALFDMEHPGHYFRRIKALSVTVPCVTGPYSSMPMKVTQVSNRIRVSKANASDYKEETGNDTRFRYNVGSVQTIETSKGEDDSGLFSLNLDDERYLPFEGSGAIGIYRLELPRDVKGFDYTTISDVILHMRYTARDGGGAFRDAVSERVRTQLSEIALVDGQKGLFQSIDIRRDRPAIWHQLKTTGTSSLTLTSDDFPYFAANAGITFPGPSETVAIAQHSAAGLQVNATPVATGLSGTPILDPIGIGQPIPISLDTPSNIQELAIIFNYELT